MTNLAKQVDGGDACFEAHDFRVKCLGVLTVGGKRG